MKVAWGGCGSETAPFILLKNKQNLRLLICRKKHFPTRNIIPVIKKSASSTLLLRGIVTFFYFETVSQQKLQKVSFINFFSLSNKRSRWFDDTFVLRWRTTGWLKVQQYVIMTWKMYVVDINISSSRSVHFIFLDMFSLFRTNFSIVMAIMARISHNSTLNIVRVSFKK